MLTWDRVNMACISPLLPQAGASSDTWVVISVEDENDNPPTWRPETGQYWGIVRGTLIIPPHFSYRVATTDRAARKT